MQGVESSWICPSDRHLLLRSKLNCGWSFRTARCKPFNDVTKNELLHINQVMSRSKRIENNERLRIGILVRRFELFQSRCCGDGRTCCILCGEKFGKFVGVGPVTCVECQKKVCHKCSVGTAMVAHLQTPLIIHLCKMCNESRELWKMSGAWFFHTMPKFIIPEKAEKLNQKVNHRSFLVSSVPKLVTDLPVSSTSSLYSHQESISIGRRRSSSSESSGDEPTVKK